MGKLADSLKATHRASKKAKKSLGSSAKFEKVMHEWGQGKLHSGSKMGPVVGKGKENQKRAIAIAFSEARRAGGQS